jgi:hypothetical protein
MENYFEGNPDRNCNICFGIAFFKVVEMHLKGIFQLNLSHQSFRYVSLIIIGKIKTTSSIILISNLLKSNTSFVLIDNSFC